MAGGKPSNKSNSRGAHIDKRVGKRIKEYRKKKGYTQEELAELIGASTIYISQIERSAAFPRYEKLIAILNVLEITANEIFIDVLDKSHEIKASLLSEKIESLPADEQNRIFSVIETMIQTANNK